MNSTDIITLIEKWGEERNFYHPTEGANILTQFAKLIEEVGELASNISRQRDIKDDIGDIVVVLTHIARLSNTDIITCIETAYNDIKDRKGKFVNGTYIKEQDLKAN